ncbi:tRNA lysidine(34) synthetase TilS [Histophilus somni]|uniref:tRNA(Ile)-lysidine synthase n=1 Tax=Histophilus somni (strain 2336) TaxID=228400 RepID=TILS_HISS2|nr:tRNA lysidine(34) synthetase TilS [Histophilus somni]B0UUD3.1 RecName: Full=tRNA(Ile)-lysidine synthase; AltName: Full=tRNA(Ile)-2-lysyl-cytidine synthase; AltName: Full=tRNA(Ile)-lysidine synthetase [Histophilus somni 2336]ACA31155.1 tRNA(Ile)-lysidine synthetase [Histophilus somni 2336]QQF85208.1 tRNA lysidine(34) synthetase TilS [Histophilus somni]QQJ90973.1 tRNA lysidine(34) synthetase TilS [Histophilus somni]
MDLLQQLQNQLNQFPSHTKLLLGFSGGLDSTVLLSLLAKLRKKQPHLSLRAIHIHHGLSQNADNWAIHCRQICQQLDISFLCEKVTINPRKGIEADAREARYQAIANHLQDNEILVTAHHQQDQTETFLLALKRGSGLQGLGAMQIQSVVFNLPIFRPLLHCTKQQLEQYAKTEKLSWIEDESNADNRYERNFLRNDILPKLRQRWQSIDNAVQRSAQHCFEQQQLINELLNDEFNKIYDKFDRTLSIANFATYSILKQKALLRTWLQHLHILMPSTIQLDNIMRNMIQAQEDRNPTCRLGNQVLRRYQKRLYATPILQDLSHIRLDIQANECINLPDNLGEICLLTKNEHLQVTWQNKQILLPLTQEKIEIRFRYSGKVKLPQGFHQEMKKCWQDHNVPVWQRTRIPLIFYGNKFKSAVGFFNNCE